MKWHVLFVLMSSLAMSSLVHSAACDASNTATSSGSVNGSNCTVTGNESIIQLNFIAGFNSGSALSAVGGNNGSTLGAQRKLSFIKAAETVADQVTSTQTIIIDAEFDELECNSTSAVLGSAGASTIFSSSNPPAGILADTFYPVGLFNDKSNSDMFLPGDDSLTGNNTGSDIVSQFNSDLGQSDCLAGSGGWYYGFDNTPSGFIGFTTVLLHEITHGLGFSSLTNPSTGAKLDGKDDIFSNFLYSLSNSRDWSLAGSMSDGQRATSATSGNGLLWNGTNVNTQAIGILTNGFNNSGTGSTTLFGADDRIEMYAPSPFEGGSSVSHFNTDTAPNELMEPSYTEYLESLGLALFLLQDIGWSIAAPANNIPTITAVDQTTNEDTPLTIDISSWGADADGDTKTFSIISCVTNITCSISASNLTLTPAENYNASTNSITVGITDGKGGAANDSFNLTVVAQNDAPTWGSVSTQNVTVDSNAININLDSLASDIDDGDTLSYSEVSCGSGLVCSISGPTLTLSATSNSGNSVVVTVQADDSNGGQADVDIDVSIISAYAITISGTPLNPDESTDISNTDLDIDVSNVISGATFSLNLSGSNVTSLIEINGSTLTVAMPDSGVFAGTYTLTVENSSADSPFSYELVRSPRLNFSATRLLENLSVQTLKIEGGAAGTIYTLGSDISELIVPNNVTAASDTDNFNPASLSLEVSEIVSSTSVEITADSIYESVISTGIYLEPARIHNLLMEDESELLLTVGTYNLDLTNLTAYNLLSAYSTDNNGAVSINLPENNLDYTAEAQHNGYTSENVSLLPSQLDQVVTLQVIPEDTVEDIIIGTSKGGSLGLGALLLLILAGIRIRRLHN
jgi:hypothetical protein